MVPLLNREDFIHIWINDGKTRNAYDFESLRAECQQASRVVQLPQISIIFCIECSNCRLQISVDVSSWWRSCSRLHLPEMPDRRLNYFNISPQLRTKSAEIQIVAAALTNTPANNGKGKTMRRLRGCRCSPVTGGSSLGPHLAPEWASEWDRDFASRQSRIARQRVSGCLIYAADRWIGGSVGSRL